MGKDISELDFKFIFMWWL